MMFWVLPFVLGMVIGFLAMHLRRRRRFQASRPVCGCGHHVCFHPGKGGCNHLRESVDLYGNQTQRRCGCVRYVGPGPDPEFLDPPEALR